MSAVLLDTSAILAHYREEPGSARVQALFEDGGTELLVSSVTIAELARRLVELGQEAGEARRISLEYAGMASVVAVDAATAVRAFELGTTATGRVPLVDALIAACASVQSATVVHRDPHFAALDRSLVASEAL